ncbi:MAG: hypothetical protein WA918_10710 [Erythrobacter sp.]
MNELAPKFLVSADLERKEVHFACSGYFDMPTMVEFQRELLAKSKPLIERQVSFRTLGDLRGFVTQGRDVAEVIRTVVMESAKLGVTRTAVVADNALAKMQYLRISEGINVEVFDTKGEALGWLRADD